MKALNIVIIAILSLTTIGCNKITEIQTAATVYGNWELTRPIGEGILTVTKYDMQFNKNKTVQIDIEVEMSGHKTTTTSTDNFSIDGNTVYINGLTLQLDNELLTSTNKSGYIIELIKK